MEKISTWHIHIKGQVQGVGFRPYVDKIAQKFQLTGWVNNDIDGVHIEFNATEVVSKIFYVEVLNNAPSLSLITSHSIKKKSSVEYENFKIIPSNNKGYAGLLLSPDFAICENCRKEIKEITNRRDNYAFTTCTQCGPRYSIISQLPYDRENTSMAFFKICSHCIREYNDSANQRYFSQTNSCPQCSILMKLYNSSQQCIEEEQTTIINRVCELWEEGKIIALKGIGGYLLTCDASNVYTIKTLRLRKHRPAKPFALMFPDIKFLEREIYVTERELKELQSPSAPIVLLRLKKNAEIALASTEIAPRLSTIGVMLPYTPLFELLLNKFKKPIVATSGNISNAPIVFEEVVALKELTIIADFILVHDRGIINPQDDSVVTYSRHFQKRIMTRRARGFAPLYSLINNKLPPSTILATGALLKSSFSLLHQRNIHISQYLGDTDNYDSLINFEKVLHRFLKLFNVKPDIVVVDMHTGYFASQLGKKLATQWGSQLATVQHHEAHFASVLGEHNLFDETVPVLGVIWDGTGLGNDGQIWGGEFFSYHHHQFSRIDHFAYFDLFLGDKMATEPRLSAFSLCIEIEEAAPILQSKFSSAEWTNYRQLIKNNQFKTSSMGRIFDAVASLLGLIDIGSFEGEAAMLLEQEGSHYFESKLTIPDSWLEYETLENLLSSQFIIRKIVQMINEKQDKSKIAAWFHVQLVLGIQRVASQFSYQKICFSGGVFQNGLLIDLSIKILGDPYQLYFNMDLPPNDENISFGQVMCYLNEKYEI